MQPDTARRVYQLIAKAATLVESIDNGERLDLETTLTSLRADLYLAEAGSGLNLEASQRLVATARGAGEFLGTRYALTCWLDEVFIQHTPYGDDWRQHSLEVSMYGGAAERGHNFWAHARKAQDKRDTDSLEVYYLCTRLGFRGDPSCIPIGGTANIENSLERLQAWCNTVEARLTLAHKASAVTNPPELPPPSYVPPLTGSDRLARIAMVGVIILLAFIPVAAVALVTWFFPH